MKILVIGVHFFSSFAWSIRRAFERLDHTVHAFDYRSNPFVRIPLIRTLYYQSLMQKKLLKTAFRLRPELIVIGKGELIRASTVQALVRQLKVPVINWFPDPVLYSYAEVTASIPFLTCLFTKNRENIDQARLLGFENVRFLAHGADRELHGAAGLAPRPEFQAEVSFVGTCYPYRDLILSQLTDFDLRIWGSRWQKSRTARRKPEAIAGLEARGLDQTRVFRQSVVNLNTHRFDDFAALNQRVFDICGSGGFQIVDFKEELADYFEIGEEIETFRSLEELKEKLRFHLRNPEKARAMGKMAQQKVLGSHTYDHRAQTMLEVALGRRSR